MVWRLAWHALFRGFPGGQVSDEILWMGATWAQLWSGIIGAVASSAVAALVAMLVLKQTLSEQRSLSNDAQLAQMKLAEHQLQEQRTALKKQIQE